MPPSPTNSPRVFPSRAREGSGSSTDPLPNPHKVARHDRLIDAQLSNNFRHDLPDQPGVIRSRRSATNIEIGDFVVVTLGTGFKILLDREDAAFAYTHYLWVHKKAATPCVYAICIETKRSKRLARFMCDVPKGMVVDHINGDGLDNRRANLRIVSSQQNNQNRAKMRGTSSQYKGVSRTRERWLAYLYVNYKQVRLGTFEDEADAARAYDAAARQQFGSCAALNFPLPGEQSAHRRDSISDFHNGGNTCA